jgi:hypothetical protein
MAMMAITTSSSIKVNAPIFFMEVFRIDILKIRTLDIILQLLA